MEEEQKKKDFIDENIIKPGINLDELTTFIESNGKSFETLNLEEMKDLLDKFKNKDKKEEETIIIKEKTKAKILVKEDKKEELKKEEPKQEEIKQEEVKNEEPKKEEPKPDEIKNEEPKKEEPKQDEIKNEEPKEEEIKKEEPKEEEINTQSDNKKSKPKSKDKAQPKDNKQPAPKKDIPLHKGLSFLESYDFKTNTQQNNKLLELAKEKKKIQITISEPKKEVAGGFFSKAIFSYRVQCPELGSDVRRTYADFEWLRNQLYIRYPLRLIPVLAKDSLLKQIGKNLKSENEENLELRKIRFLNKFMESILEKKILATSPILYEFLIYDEKNMAKYKKFLENKPYQLEVGLNNLITVKGNVKCELKENTVNDSEAIYNKSQSLKELYNRIISCIDLCINDFNNLTHRFKEISVYFNQLNKNITAFKYKNADDMKESFNNLKSLFDKWSKNVNSQTEFFNNVVKENLNYMSLELNEVSNTFKRYRDYKFEYEDFTVMINIEKSNMVNTYINEELKKEVNKGKTANQIKYNKNKLEQLFSNKNLLLIEEKKRLVTTMHYLIRDYNKLISLHNKKIKEIDELVQKTVVIDFIREE